MCKPFALAPTGPVGPPPLTKGRLKERALGGVYKALRTRFPPTPLLRGGGFYKRFAAPPHISSRRKAQPCSLRLPFVRGAVGRSRLRDRGCRRVQRLQPRPYWPCGATSPYEGEVKEKRAVGGVRKCFRLLPLPPPQRGWATTRKSPKNVPVGADAHIGPSPVPPAGDKIRGPPGRSSLAFPAPAGKGRDEVG